MALYQYSIISRYYHRNLLFILYLDTCYYHAGLWSYGFAVFQSIGYAIDAQQITVQTRIISKDTAIIPHRRIQALQQKQHLLHRKQSLATLDMAILNKGSGRHFVIKELRTTDSDYIADWYSYQEKTSSDINH